MIKIAVIAGTPVDTRMGVDLITGRGAEAAGFPVSRTPEEQTAFQVGSQPAREAAVGAILQSRVDSQAGGGAFYPETTAAWEEAQVVVKGTVAALIVAQGDQARAVEAFNALFA